jgi:hypothetical protein
MANDILRYCATDKEIYDILMSAKQRINDTALRDMGKSRGIFFSPMDSRDTLAGQLALLPHDYDALVELMGQSENPNRAEKVASFTLNAKLTAEDIKEVCKTFIETSPSDEKVTAYAETANKYRLQVKYSEVDYSKTTLLQRRNREADLKFVIEGDKTTIRMPANPKAREIAELIKQGLDKRKKTDIPTELIEISDLSADNRTVFFTSLISKLEGYSLRNVTNIKVQSSLKAAPTDEVNPEEEDDDETVDAKDEMLSVVENVAMRGQSLLASPEYKQLKQKGFYLTSITWISQQATTPYNRFEFEAGFEEPEDGKSFRYNVRGVYRQQEGEYTKTLRPLKDDHKQEIFPMIERTAHEVLATLRKKNEDGKDDGNGKAQSEPPAAGSEK